MGQNVVVTGFRKRQPADHAARVPAGAVRIGVLHAVRIETGLGIGREHPAGAPFVERLGRVRVAVAVRGDVARQDQPHRVVLGLGLERGAQVVVDHVVGWCDERRELGGRALRLNSGVPDTGKGREVGHGALRVPGVVGNAIGLYHRESVKPPNEPTLRVAEEANPMTASGHYDAYTAFSEGMRLLTDGNVHAAVIALEQARELEPAKGSVREALARAYFRTGRFAAAEEEFNATLAIEPVNDYAQYGVGLCRLKAGDRAKARVICGSRR